jgi:hypothetical protein
MDDDIRIFHHCDFEMRLARLPKPVNDEFPYLIYEDLAYPASDGLVAPFREDLGGWAAPILILSGLL